MHPDRPWKVAWHVQHLQKPRACVQGLSLVGVDGAAKARMFAQFLPRTSLCSVSRQSLSKQDAVIADLQTQITALRAQSRRRFHVFSCSMRNGVEGCYSFAGFGTFELFHGVCDCTPSMSQWLATQMLYLQASIQFGPLSYASRCSLCCQLQAFWLSILLRLWGSSGSLGHVSQTALAWCMLLLTTESSMDYFWEVPCQKIGCEQLSFLYLCDVPQNRCPGPDLLRSPQQMHWPATWTSCRSCGNNVTLRLRKDWPGAWCLSLRKKASKTLFSLSFAMKNMFLSKGPPFGNN